MRTTITTDNHRKVASLMPDTKKNEKKYNLILDALQQLLEDRKIQNISVSEIAQKAGIGKGSIYYYFPSKEAILDALYEQPLSTAKNLAAQTDVSPFVRMAMLFQACQNSSVAFIKQNDSSSGSTSAQDLAFLHQKYLSHVVSELKPALTEIIRQGVDNGEIHFDYPAALAEIVLIVIAVKLDNSLLPSTPAETLDTLQGLISLLEEGTKVTPGTLSYLLMTPYRDQTEE